MSWTFFPLVGKPQEVKNDNDLFKSISPGSRFLELKKTLNWNPQRTVKIQCKPKIQRFLPSLVSSFYLKKINTNDLAIFTIIIRVHSSTFQRSHEFFFRLAPRSSIRFFSDRELKTCSYLCMWYCHKRYIVFINIELFSKAGENGTDERILNSRILVTAVYVIASTINHSNAASWLFTPFFNRDIIGYQIMSFDQFMKLSMSLSWSAFKLIYYRYIVQY